MELKLTKPWIDANALSQDDIDAINRYLLIETEKAPADIALLFGNQALPTLVQMAAECAIAYHQGFFDTIIVSGAPKVQGTDHSESSILKNLLIEFDVPSDKILQDDQATNSEENVKFAKALLTENAHLQKRDVKSVYCFGTALAGRRFIMTMLKRWPEVTPVFHGIHTEKNLHKDWAKAAETRNYVVGQYNRIAPYHKQGWLAEFDPESLNARIRSLKKRP